MSFTKNIPKIKKVQKNTRGGCIFSCYVESKHRAIRAFKPINRGCNTLNPI